MRICLMSLLEIADISFWNFLLRILGVGVGSRVISLKLLSQRQLLDKRITADDETEAKKLPKDL